MAALREAVTTAWQWDVATDTVAETGSLWKIGSEGWRVMGCYWDAPPQQPATAGGWRWVVQRRIGGSSATTYGNGTSITAYAAESPNTSSGGPHTHAESEVTSLTSDLAGKAASGHNHDASYAPTHAHPYAATSHAHLDGDLPAGLARDAEVAAAYAPIHAHPYEASGAVTTHAGLADPHPGYLTPAEGNAAYSATGHSHAHPDLATHDGLGLATDAELTTHAATPHGGGSIPAGVIVMWGGLLANIPSGWALCNGANGTPDLRDRFIKGAANAANPGATGGAATHTHAAHSDHAALAHSGITVGDHAALSHSAHAGMTVANHADVTNHVHLEQLQGGTTGTTTGTHLMGSAATGGSLRSSAQSTLNPTTGGVAAQVHTVQQPSAHSDHALQTHTIGQGNNHAAQSHSAHDSPNSEPAYYALAFIQKT